MTPLLANVMFPLKGRTVQTLQKSLAFTDCALVNAETHLWRAQNPGFNDINNISYTIGPGAFNDGSSRSQSMQPQEPIEAHTAQTPNSWIRRILLPNQRDGRHQTELRTIPHRGLFDAQLNYEQSHAVNSVCESDYGVVPYLISGPPGTGKTKTLVEIAMQLLNTHSVDHLLICAPSDQAADTLALRLKKYLKPTELLRLNGPWRPVAEVNEKLTMHGYTYMEDDMFYLPPFKQFMAYNVVVTSCGDASILMEARLTNMDLWTLEYEMTTTFRPERKEFPALHWGAILVDEAAQATELDVLSAINVGCPPQKYPNDMAQPRFIMAGDENQLGPRTASRYPPFVRSLFARLLDRPLYKEHPLSRSNMKPSSGPPVLKKSMLPMLFPPFTNLIRNYRSHPAIISVPSSLFYNDTLLPEAPISNTSLQRSSLWEGRQWPVLFVPNKGRDEIEQDGGGWYNKEEGKKACSLAQTLVSEGVQQADICIMAPFAAQVKILRNAIRSSAYGSGSGLWDVNIGPLEAFQGLEKRVVIICITRSRSRFVADDIKRGLGILHFPRKMNVALTRAKEALIVIGNPSVLKEDTHWLQWMSFCSRNGLVAEDVGIDEVEIHGGAKIGVLEKALLARDEKSNVSGVVGGKVLGGGAVVLEQDFSGEYDAWAEALREALDEEDESEEQDGDEEEEEEEGEGDHDGHGVVT
ncbi:P-loop containing nucleoside triphosphate hydrolase protein [Massarina eburnea CBS 473.64]|uniref:P-loop containing nucleoside triphosphate hydrolase protein n=1 Tax=Massarina eburnea CBS 473.64 TaxID=1395130 RepID=A0A6A6S712_9PLEO|nr:P-loop containing nucleoside triphosphate hydrolase protein [Massarina eburnea CBS 473.64]